MKIGSQLFDLRLPDTRNRRREPVFELSRHLLEDGVRMIEDCRHAFVSNRKQASRFKNAGKLELHRMEKSAARDGIHLLERHRPFGDSQMIDSLEGEPVWAGGKMLQRRGRVAPPRQPQLTQ